MSDELSKLEKLSLLRNRLFDIFNDINDAQNIYIYNVFNEDVWTPVCANITAVCQLWTSLCDCKEHLSVLSEHVDNLMREEEQ